MQGVQTSTVGITLGARIHNLRVGNSLSTNTYLGAGGEYRENVP